MTSVNTQPSDISGTALTLFRRLNGMRQAHLAEMLNVSHATISNWERGTHPVPRWVRPYLMLIIKTAGLTLNTSVLREPEAEEEGSK